MKFEEQSSTDIETYLETKKTILVPVGSIEQHGPHLPLGTDSFLVDFIVEKISDTLQIIKMPIIQFGPAFNSSSHAGTISISTRLLYDFLKGILLSLYAQGFRVFYIFSGHAEQSQLITLRELSEDFMQSKNDTLFHLLCTYHINKIVSKTFFDASNEFHAGAIETSLMLYLKPKLVDRSKFNFGKKEIPEHKIVKDKKKYWKSGVYGDPRNASEELGKKIFDNTIKYIIDYITQNS